MVCVVTNTGKPLMPTTEYRARKLLKSGKAIIYKHRPFTIQLLYREDGYTQPIEYACDTGYQHIGISIKSRKHEYVNEQRNLLKDEVERHEACRKYRRTRRNRLRYRKARFDNRTSSKKEGWLAPSIVNKKNMHLQILENYKQVMPITTIIFEVGQFDTQVLKAVEEGKPLPQGTDYQQGEQYGYATLREAVFSRDKYACICCGKSAIKDGVILRMHHLNYLKHDRTNKMSNLATVCTKCHTSKNHQKGGKLYGLKPKLKSFKGAAFMTSVKFAMINAIKEQFSDVEAKFQYGAKTKMVRNGLNIPKSHSNDAYCMGEFQPKHRTKCKHYVKCRRNSRVLSRFYDAKYIDLRDGSIKAGKQLSCERTNRKTPRNNPNNLRIYRGKKVSKGRVSVRKQHYQYRPNDIVWFEGRKYLVKGMQDKGTRIALQNHLPISIKKIEKCTHTNGWAFIP